MKCINDMDGLSNDEGIWYLNLVGARDIFQCKLKNKEIDKNIKIWREKEGCQFTPRAKGSRWTRALNGVPYHHYGLQVVPGIGARLPQEYVTTRSQS